jgi:glutamate-ammonia-ligase adenylyltransferase
MTWDSGRRIGGRCFSMAPAGNLMTVMKPDAQQILAQCQQCDPQVAREHVQRLEPDYFARFDINQVARHVQGLAQLSRDRPAEVMIEPGESGTVACTVLAWDYPSVFSLIAGVLAGMGFSIDEGEIFTYQRRGEDSTSTPPPTSRRRHRPGALRRRHVTVDPLRRRRIIDHFVGRLVDGDPIDAWMPKCREQLEQIIALLERGAAQEAKHRVNEMVTRRLAHTQQTGAEQLLPMQIDTETAGGRTRLKVVGQDTPAFLYSLSTALSLQGLAIERIQIHTSQGHVEDIVELVDSSGNPVTDPQGLNRVRFTALLTKQFTYFLDTAPDPYTALARYEQMVNDLLRAPTGGQWMEMLSDPRAMQNLARLLGASDFLWEEFIRLQYEALMPILRPQMEQTDFAESIETLPQRLREAINNAKSFSEKRKALNQFKDREIFLLDLDHILRPEVDFRALAERLTILAENVVAAASDLAYAALVEQYGQPTGEDGKPVPYAVFGLGKLGGAALGYASDIELLFLYDGAGQTDGHESIAVGEFYNLLGREVSRSIEAKQEGIFRVDPRLRPYGKNSPLACTAQTFEQYYGQEGDAHSFERLALVRMRTIAGDESLGKRVETLRDRLIYDNPQSIRLEELWDMRRKQYRQKQRGDTFNAKYSSGALVDVEYTAQILQVRHAPQYNELRTPRLHKALEGLAKVGAMPAEQAEQLNNCYDFLRNLINGLRMLRGSAQDLFLPADDSDEFLFLARRLEYGRDHTMDPAMALYVDLHWYTALVRSFVTQYFGRDALPDEKYGNLADVMLLPDLDDELAVAILDRTGLKQNSEVLELIREAVEKSPSIEPLAQLCLLVRKLNRGEVPLDDVIHRTLRLAMSAADEGVDLSNALGSRPTTSALTTILLHSASLSEMLTKQPHLLDRLGELPVEHAERGNLDAIQAFLADAS